MTDDPDKLDDFDIDDLGEEDERDETVTVYELRSYLGDGYLPVTRHFTARSDASAVETVSAWIGAVRRHFFINRDQGSFLGAILLS